MEWMFWGVCAGTPQLSVPQTGVTGSRGGLAGWQMLLLHPGVLGFAAGITGWVVEQCQPPPAALGGFMSPGRKPSLKSGI